MAFLPSGQLALADHRHHRDPDGVFFAPGPTGDTTGAADTRNLQEVLDLSRTRGGGTIHVRAGTYVVKLGVHPQSASHYSALVIGTRTRLILEQGTTVRLAANASSGHATNNSLLLNYSITGGGDEGIVVEGGVWDGDAANQTLKCSGLLVMRARNVLFRGVIVKNCRGTASSGGNENFLFSASLAADLSYENCTAYRDAGSVSSGFSANSSTNIRYTQCAAYGLSVANGFTHNTCRNLTHVNCLSYLNTGKGFNTEASDNVTYVGCIAGCLASSVASPTFSADQDLGNTNHGFTINESTNVHLAGCISRNNDQGVNWSANAQGRVVAGDYSDNDNFGMGVTTPANVRLVGPTFTSNPTDLAIPGTDVTSYPGYAGAANPAVPATTVALTNPFPADCTVYISGGTVSDVRVAGQSTGLTSGSFRVLAAQPITLTYTVAPTWRWFLH